MSRCSEVAAKLDISFPGRGLRGSEGTVSHGRGSRGIYRRGIKSRRSRRIRGSEVWRSRVSDIR